MRGIPEYNDDTDSAKTAVEWLDSVFGATDDNKKFLHEFKSEIMSGESVSKVFQIGDTKKAIIRIGTTHLYTDDGERLIMLDFIDLTDEIDQITTGYEDELSHYKSVMNSTFCGIIRFERIDNDYIIVEANDMAAKTVGLRSGEEIVADGTNSLSNVVFGEDMPMISKGFDNLLYIGDSFHFTHRVISAKTNEVCWITGVAVAINKTDSDGNTARSFVQSTFVNTTDRADLEDAKRKLLQLEARLSESEKINRQKNTLLEEVAGNIRSNLNNIVGKAVIAKTRPENVAENTDSIIESSRAVIELINNVLDIAMIEERKLFLNETQFEIAELFENIKSAAMSSIRAKSQRLNISYKNVVHTAVIGDSARLETIFTNLLSNAVKYTPMGGAISVTITETLFKQGHCNFFVQISDNGVGMTKEKLMTVLSPYSLRGKLGGNFEGYGLPIANELIKLLGGSIRIDSNPGIGTNVYAEFTLKAWISEEFIDTETEYSLEGKYVLLVEDNEISRDLFAGMLEAEGAFVEKADDGRTAVEAFERSPVYHFDMIFMDIAMPDIDGVEATKHIRSMYRPDARTVPIIALTAKAPGEEVAKGLNYGMNAYEQKPFDMKRIRKLLTELSI
jgi:signal transduction histidine kinase/CheY-like chemotaxis protein